VESVSGLFWNPHPDNFGITIRFPVESVSGLAWIIQIDRIKHPNPDKYPNQRIFLVKIDEYIYSVPYVEDDEKVFLRTIIPNSKSTKKYLGEKR